METQNQSITIEATIEAPNKKVWEYYTMPEHITNWNFASDDWHCPEAENDLRAGGKYKARMEAKDGSMGFDFEAIYNEVIDQKKVIYIITDGGVVTTDFENIDGKTKVTTTFDAENENPVDMQRDGWQAILNNFKKYAESKSDEGLQTLHFSVEINAPKEKAWDTMLNDETYRKWTSAFMEGSYFEGSWEQGSKILFLDPDGNGIVSRIAENRHCEFISIEHIGFIAEGVEDTESEGAKAFAGAHENYTFRENDGKTEFSLDMDTSEEWKTMFEEMWPKALAKLKKLSEKE